MLACRRDRTGSRIDDLDATDSTIPRAEPGINAHGLGRIAVALTLRRVQRALKLSAAQVNPP
jgi:hypothetical protein